MNSFWLVLTSLACFALAYRFYGAFLAAKVAVLNDSNLTPAHRLRDGVDYHPTNRLVLFGYHFAAIAGSGPLIGPVLASQWGYFPGFAWIVVGAVLAGGVHDFIVLFASVRHDGKTLSRIAGSVIGRASGFLAAIITLLTIITVLAGTALVVVNTLSESAWATFTIVVTIPAALLTGLWMYRIRPGQVKEASIVGVSIVLAGVFFGKPFAESELGTWLVFSKSGLSLLLPIYVAVASVLPVWLLMCPRDYLSSYMKIGVIALLAVGILVVQPGIKMPATTPFIHGGGPVVSGTVWPFVCIVIMCGALSGFHALIASGTTPKMIYRESDIRPIAYGAMVLEGFVAICALIAACVLEPGDYFAINTPQDTPQQQVQYSQMMEKTKTLQHWDLAPRELSSLEAGTNEKLVGRVGGAVTLAVGMAKVFQRLPGMGQLTAYWYHFIIMFEALFILTLLETGTRVARFVFQECIGHFKPEETSVSHQANWALNIIMSVAVCLLWGFLVYSGSMNSLWRIFGIANQLIAVVALAVGSVFILKTAKRKLYALVTAVPLLFVAVTVFTAGTQAIQSWLPEFRQADLTDAKRVYLWIICALAASMMLLTATVLVNACRACVREMRPGIK